MDIKYSQNVNNIQSNEAQQKQNTASNNVEVKFADELDNVKKTELENETQNIEQKAVENNKDDNVEINQKENELIILNKHQLERTEDVSNELNKNINQKLIDNSNIKNEPVNEALNGLNTVIDEFNKLNQKDDIEENLIKPIQLSVDKKDKTSEEDDILIDNNINIPEQTDKINIQMSGNMNFNSDNPPFSEFVNQEKTDKAVLHSSSKELAEEKAILSTMEENIAIANKNMALAKTMTVENEHGIQKVDKRTNIIVDTIVNYDNVVMDKNDVDFFVKLVENGTVDLNEIKGAEKSSQISKTLADLLAKSMNENKPIRIDFDNNISVIIKIDRAGKISADFLPSSQVAEAYLKENLPLLKQRFDDNNIEYNELNQRKQQKQNTDDNRKKGRKDE